MIKFSDDFKSFSIMASFAIASHRFSVWVLMASLTIRIAVARWHIFKNFFHMTRDTSDGAVFSGQLKFCTLIMIKFYPRKSGRHMTKRTRLIDLSFIMRVAMAITAFLTRNIFVLPIKMAFITIED